MSDEGPLLEVEHLQVHYPVRGGGLLRRTGGAVQAVSDVSFALHAGETLGVVGESGCGKTTLIRGIVRLIQPTGGSVRFRGVDITTASRRKMAPLRREMQMVFQDPQASLNPRKRIRQILATPLRVAGLPRREIEQRSRELLSRVGLNPEHLDRFPHEFSGGQRQRIGIARALALGPKVIMLDEPVSALDVSIQAQVINLLDVLQKELGLTFVFVAHDLSVVRHVSNRIAVMYLGKIVELAPSQELYDKPIHHYTRTLLSAIPIPDPRENRERVRTKVEGEPPNPIAPPRGCHFHTRCPAADGLCRTIEPPLAEYAGGHLAACHHPLAVSDAEIAAARRSPASPLSAGIGLPGAPVEDEVLFASPATVKQTKRLLDYGTHGVLSLTASKLMFSGTGSIQWQLPRASITDLRRPWYGMGSWLTFTANGTRYGLAFGRRGSMKALESASYLAISYGGAPGTGAGIVGDAVAVWQLRAAARLGRKWFEQLRGQG